MIGKRSTLWRVIRKITGINRGALQWPWTVSGYSIATRISWAARRHTTRAEDQAYSLLGILGVNMPLLYGESHRAFHRLQEELIKVSDDESLFAHSGPNILAESPAAFKSATERYELSRSSQHKPYSITNMGLNIELPLIIQADPGYPLGVLNCHHGDDYKHFFAIPLRATFLGIYLRLPGPAQLVKEAVVKTAKKTPVIIRLFPLSVSKITYVQQFQGIQMRDYKHSVYVYTSSVPWQARHERVTLHLNPKRREEYEVAVHEFIGESEEHSFVVTIIFERAGANAGLLIYTPSEHEALRRQGPDDAKPFFNIWVKQGKSARQSLQLTPNWETLLIEAKISREIRLNQDIWVLSIQNTQAKIIQRRPK